MEEYRSKTVRTLEEHVTVNLDKDQSIKTLGLQWNDTTRITKRSILSHIAQIFDLLGLLGPVIVTAKILMQRLWQLNLSWDESVPTNIYTMWSQFKNQIKHLNTLYIPRWIINVIDPECLELHGFCDASEQAYGACIYLRVTHAQNHTNTLICSRSRVFPIRNISLPKLELCGALLLARLLKQAVNAININIDKIYYWTDSTITLSWIKSTARTWKTFVANRVSEIQDITDISCWNHVSTNDNPADFLSRGLLPQQLVNCTVWWQGPAWLAYDTIKWPNITSNSNPEEIPERRINVTSAVITNTNNEFFSKYSSFVKLIRIISYCLRFKTNILLKLSKSNQKVTGPIMVSEFRNATTCILKQVQATSFSQDLCNLIKHQKVHRKSKLLCLNPFLDDEKLIRVGGRLRNSNLSYAQKHPILLPKCHNITKLIITHEHIKTMHGGIQSTLAAVRENYWPIDARNTVRYIVKKCITCFKTKPVQTDYIMGDLPAHRLTPARPFTNCGVDYFGPLNVRDGRRNQAKTTKVYGAIFVCFASKAVHLELVCDLTSEAFINALRRFMSRRGKPSNIYSDNATNFVGANKELHKLRSIFLHDNFKNNIIHRMSTDNINWHFIPPKAPHFGGIWEAAVKSAKHHIRRIVGNASLNFEEMYTILVQIEAILNSRPLTAISSDPNDLSFLTPAHFLIGDSLLSTVNPDLTYNATNRLSHWQHIEQLRQHFWKRWTKEYLHQLQSRSKWKTQNDKSLQVGQLVIVREDNVPPLRWLLGRVEEVHPGKDHIIRTASIRTSAGTIRRSTKNLYPLPIDN